MNFVQIEDTIEFARELAIDLELSGSPTETDIQAAVDVMNHHLFGVGANTRALLGAQELYKDLPTYEAELELLREEDIQQAKIERVIAKAKIDSFHWLGSASITGFGLQVYGVDMLAPIVKHANSAFIPLDAVGVRLAT